MTLLLQPFLQKWPIFFWHNFSPKPLRNPIFGLKMTNFNRKFMVGLKKNLVDQESNQGQNTEILPKNGSYEVKRPKLWEDAVSAIFKLSSKFFFLPTAISLYFWQSVVLITWKELQHYKKIKVHWERKPAATCSEQQLLSNCSHAILQFLTAVNTSTGPDSLSETLIGDCAVQKFNKSSHWLRMR